MLHYLMNHLDNGRGRAKSGEGTRGVEHNRLPDDMRASAICHCEVISGATV